MASLLSTPSSHLILHQLLRPPTPPSSSSSLLIFSLFKSLTSTRHHHPTQPLRTLSLSAPPHPLLSPSRSLSLSSSSHLSKEPKFNEQVEQVENSDDNFESEEEEEEQQQVTVTVSDSTERALISSISTKLLSLSVKEKKELASYAHSLGKKLKSQQVGKSGVTDSVAAAMIETLEANELLKLKIHGTCPGELEDVVKQLEEATGSVVVGQIGRTVILYRPSLTKLKAEEKREQHRRIFRRKQPALKLPFENKGQAPRLSGRGRRGSTRFFSSP